jgi:hypothetical protein
MFQRFRSFLQTLKPGEIGFCIASVGSLSVAILFANRIEQQKLQLLVQKREKFQSLAMHVDQLVGAGTPLEGLSQIKFYRRKLREQVVKDLGLADASWDEICDEWVRRRNMGDQEALEIEKIRLKLKRFWHSMEGCAKFIEESELDEAGDRPSDQTVLTSLLSGGSGKTEANDRLILKTIMFLETLDRACCRNHPKCDWERDAPSFYGFLRTHGQEGSGVERYPVLSGHDQSQIARDWPGPYSNDDDFDEDAPPINSRLYEQRKVPSSRIAQQMAVRHQMGSGSGGGGVKLSSTGDGGEEGGEARSPGGARRE